MEKLKKALDVVDQEVAEMRKRFVYHCFINLSKPHYYFICLVSKNAQLHGLDAFGETFDYNEFKVGFAYISELTSHNQKALVKC